MIALSGVRSSCDMLARNSDLCLFATSSCALFSWISRNRRAFWIAITAWSAKVFSSAICFSVKGPATFRPSEIVPMPLPSQNIGAKTIERKPAVSALRRTMDGDVGIAEDIRDNAPRAAPGSPLPRPFPGSAE